MISVESNDADINPAFEPDNKNSPPVPILTVVPANPELDADTPLNRIPNDAVTDPEVAVSRIGAVSVYPPTPAILAIVAVPASLK